jgi:hypothetical protein
MTRRLSWSFALLGQLCDRASSYARMNLAHNVIKSGVDGRELHAVEGWTGRAICS